MTTYSKETALYDTGAIKNGIDDASTKASNFLSVDNSGIMVYDGSNGTQAPSSPSSTTRNVFIDSDSVDVRKGTTTLASFGTETVIKTTDGTELAHFGYAEGQAESGTAIKPYYTLGKRTANSTLGNYSTSEGYNNTASGYTSHAEGFNTEAEEGYAHAEGAYSAAKGIASHAEGFTTQARGSYSHAEGDTTISYGNCSHVSGYRTFATEYAQTVIGLYNKDYGTAPDPDAGDYAFIIGNGTSNSARSNALTVGWDGNITVQNHSSPIGTTHNEYPTSTVSVNSSTATALCSVSLEPGLWLCVCAVRHPQANGGVRRANLRTASGSTEIDVQEVCNANNSVQQQLVRLVRNTGTTNVVYYLNAYQNSGSKLTYAAGDNQYANYICAVRIL